MDIEQRMKETLSSVDNKPEKFRGQLHRFRAFKKKLLDAGVDVNDKYEIPLMHRIGHTIKNDQSA